MIIKNAQPEIWTNMETPGKRAYVSNTNTFYSFQEKFRLGLEQSLKNLCWLTEAELGSFHSVSLRPVTSDDNSC